MAFFDDTRERDDRLPHDRPDRDRVEPPPAITPSLPTVLGTGWGEGSDRRRARRPAPPPSDNGATSLPSDIIGDIPPPPIPQPPPITGPGVAGIPGTEAGTFARPGTAAAMPFRTAAYGAARQQRFGPGAPIVGGAGMTGFGGDEGGMGLGSPDDVAELLRALAASRGPVA